MFLAAQSIRQFARRLLTGAADELALRSRNLRESDIFLASYPRSGNTWVRVILANMILGPGALRGLKDLDAVVPDIHRGVPGDEPRALPRIIKTHQSFAHRHESHRPELYRRFIYVVRNPVDSIRSYHDFLTRSEPGFAQPLNEFALAVVNGAVHPGSWNEHVLSWNQLDGREMLLVRYEDLKSNPMEGSARMAAFIGRPMDVPQLKAVLNASDLKAMRALDDTAPLVPNNKEFIRREDEARKYAEELREETISLIHSRSAEAMKEVGYATP